MTWEDVLVQVRAGRMMLTARPCGHQVTGWSIDYPVEHEPHVEPLWDGGPMVAVPSVVVQPHTTGEVKATVRPCGHEFTTLVAAPVTPGQ